jgi:glycosyltransferase involved in cell wall biosynthesis
MRVAYDMTIARVNAAGSGGYAASVATALAAQLGDEFLPIAFSLGSRALPGTPAARLAAAARDVYWWPFEAGRQAVRARAAILHIPVGRGPLRPPVPLVLTLHDTAILRYPEFFRPWSRNYARFFLPRAVAAAGAIVTSSDASRTEIVERFGVPEKRVVTVSAGVDPGFAPVPPESSLAHDARARYTLPDRFIMSVGAIEPRKNLVRLLYAVAALRAQGHDDMTLIHVGPPGWLGGDVGRAITELRLADHVRFLGYVPRDHLAAVYRRATLLAFPSLYEGFGLPVLEAMACGCAVVTSSVSSLPEVGGDAVTYVDPASVESIADGIRQLWTNPERRAEMRRRGIERAATFTWAAVAQRTVAAYEIALG